MIYLISKNKMCGEIMVRKKNSNSLAENRKARHDYFVEETIEAGIALVGTEVKSIRAGKCNLKDSYADVDNGEIIIKNIINIDIIKVDNEKMIEQEYKKLLENATHENLIKIIKTSYLRNDKRKREKKKISEKDDTYFKLAEKILYNEFSVALKMNYEDTKKYVVDSVEKGYKDE